MWSLLGNSVWADISSLGSCSINQLSLIPKMFSQKQEITSFRQINVFSESLLSFANENSYWGGKKKVPRFRPFLPKIAINLYDVDHTICYVSIIFKFLD